MCGISGIFNLNSEPIQFEDLRCFTDSMLHRGPDASGYELFENDTLGLGQRRLSILDLSESGKQPMSYADQRFWITYNGEIFNFEEIKSELRAKGHAFKTETDTEMILAAYAEWGTACLNRFNGMWAMAIWDNREKELFLSRDRFGIKPLYYLFEPGKRFAFASETRAFKFLNAFSRSTDIGKMKMNIADPYALEGLGYTIFDGILQVLPGHYMLLKKGTTPKQQRWWQIFDHVKTMGGTIEDQAAGFYEIFRDACRIRLISDVPVATALSGGLDSTAVYSTVFDILKNERPGRVNKDAQRAFTAVFPGLPQNEAEYAAKAAAYTGGPIQFISDDQENIAARIEYETELCDFINPAPITSISSVYRGMRKQGIIVSLDGHGVDEMMYGYRDMVFSLYNKADQSNDTIRKREYGQILRDLYHEDLRASVNEKLNSASGKNNIRSNAVVQKIKNLIKGKSGETEFLSPNLESLSDKPYDFSKLPLSERMLYNETFQHTLPALLRNFDRAGMINSVEIRMPFMDWRLVSFIFSLPSESKIGAGYTKRILRQAMIARMDESLRTRTYKVGIGSPVEHWFNGPLKNWVMDTIKDIPLRQKAEASIKEDGKWSADMVRSLWLSINTDLIR